jgi:hypothetical protein
MYDCSVDLRDAQRTMGSFEEEGETVFDVSLRTLSAAFCL